MVFDVRAPLNFSWQRQTGNRVLRRQQSFGGPVSEIHSSVLGKGTGFLLSLIMPTVYPRQ